MLSLNPAFSMHLFTGKDSHGALTISQSLGSLQKVDTTNTFVLLFHILLNSPEICDTSILKDWLV